MIEKKKIPVDLDVGPYFDMGCPTLTYQKAKIENENKRVRNYKIKTDDF